MARLWRGNKYCVTIYSFTPRLVSSSIGASKPSSYTTITSAGLCCSFHWHSWQINSNTLINCLINQQLTQCRKPDQAYDPKIFFFIYDFILNQWTISDKLHPNGQRKFSELPDFVNQHRSRAWWENTKSSHKLKSQITGKRDFNSS